MNSIQYIIEYFSKFPLRTAVLACFKRSTQKEEGYTALKNYITELPAALLPEITTFIVTQNETKLANAIKTANGFIMIVEYGPFRGSPLNRAGAREIEWSLAITICHKLDLPDSDMVEEAIISDNCLALLISIAQQIELDKEDICGYSQMAESGIDLAPIEPALLYQCTGWVLSFKKNAYTLI